MPSTASSQSYHSYSRVLPQVLFLKADGRHCSGVVLSQSWILTSAYCDVTTSTVARVTGVDGQDRNTTVNMVVAHPDYNSANRKNDLALVEVAAHMPSGVIPVCRPQDGQDGTGNQVLMTSWLEDTRKYM